MRACAYDRRARVRCGTCVIALLLCLQKTIVPNVDSKAVRLTLFGAGGRQVPLRPEDCLHVTPRWGVSEVRRLCVETLGVSRVSFTFFSTSGANLTQQVRPVGRHALCAYVRRPPMFSNCGLRQEKCSTANGGIFRIHLFFAAFVPVA